MSYTTSQLLKMASNYEQLAVDTLVATAKKKEKKKLDPKAKVRNRGTVCVPAESAKDKKDHFPINDADQARNALARVHQYSSVPEWYSGSLKGLQALVARKVKAKYPKIDVGGKKEKKSFSLIDELVSFAEDIQKYGQASETMTNNLSLISASLVDSAGKLAELKNNPGDVPPGNIDAAEMQITNARNQLAQAQREAAKGANAQQLDYYLADIKKYYGYAQSYVKRADIWDNGLNQIIDTAVNEAKNPPAPQPAGQQQQQQTPAAKPTAKPAGIPYRKEVEIAQQQLMNMGGYNLGTTGRYGNGVDGQLGRKTMEALKQYNPNVSYEQAIKELNQKYNAGPEPVKQEPPPLPKPQTPSEKAGLYSTEDVFPTEKPPTQTWGTPKKEVATEPGF